MNEKDAVDEAYNKGWEAITKSLEDNNIKFDNNTGNCLYVDDKINKKTYMINLTVEECPQYEDF